MLYRIVKPFATIALKTNFRRIYFSNAQVIPIDKPVILAVNHPSAFLEPCLLACLLPQPLYFLVRGDMFTSILAKNVFKGLHMLPIYRKRDGGFGNVRQNFSTFEICFEILSQNKTLMILAEGTTIQEKRLRPIQKGPARIAFGALKKNKNLDLKIVPVGVNYTYADRFRSNVMFEFGEPISVQNYKSEFQKHPDKGIRALTKELKDRLQKHIIIIEQKEDEDLVEQLFVLNRSKYREPFFPIVSRRNRWLKEEKQIADTINKMSNPVKNKLEEKVNKYFEKLDQNGLEDWAVAQNENSKVIGNLTIFMGFIPFVLGYLGNYPPLLISQFVASKYVKYLEFMASVKIVVAVGAIPLYYVILFTISILMGNFMLLMLVFLLPFFGYYSLIYREYFQKWKMIRALKRVDKQSLKKLEIAREEILDFPGFGNVFQ